MKSQQPPSEHPCFGMFKSSAKLNMEDLNVHLFLILSFMILTNTCLKMSLDHSQVRSPSELARDQNTLVCLADPVINVALHGNKEENLWKKSVANNVFGKRRFVLISFLNVIW